MHGIMNVLPWLICTAIHSQLPDYNLFRQCGTQTTKTWYPLVYQWLRVKLIICISHIVVWLRVVQHYSYSHFSQSWQQGRECMHKRLSHEMCIFFFEESKNIAPNEPVSFAKGLHKKQDNIAWDHNMNPNEDRTMHDDVTWSQCCLFCNPYT